MIAVTTRVVATRVNVDMTDPWKVVGFRTLSPEALAAVQGRAAGQGLSLSDYLRHLVARDLEGSGGRGDGGRALGLLRDVQLSTADRETHEQHSRDRSDQSSL